VKSYWHSNTEEYPDGDSRFVRYEFELIDSDFSKDYVLCCYYGDATVWKPRPHGNSVKRSVPFYRNAPIVKSRILAAHSASGAKPKKLYDKLRGM